MDHKFVLRWLKRRRVAVLKGGWSRERSISLKTGAEVEVSLRRSGLTPISIDVDPDFLSQIRARRVDFCFIALHGKFGEDGGIQSLLEFLKIPYTGTGPLSSALAMDKNLSKKVFVQTGVSTPDWITLSQKQFRSRSKEYVSALRPFLARGPVFIKPIDQGSAIGAKRAAGLAQAKAALRHAFEFSEEALIERFVPGRELTVGILGDRCLPVVEIIPEHSFYDFYSKYAKGGSRHLVPADLRPATTREVQNQALRAFQALSCHVYGRVDVLLPKSGKPQVLELNTIPGMTATSLLPDAARAAGISFDSLVLEIIQLSLIARGVIKKANA